VKGSKGCPACEHLERRVIDNALRIGQAPRSVVRRYAGLNRRALTRHRDEGHHKRERNAA
jgi:hypothetical protein